MLGPSASQSIHLISPGLEAVQGVAANVQGAVASAGEQQERRKRSVMIAGAKAGRDK
jgi:hypothetical protein